MENSDWKAVRNHIAFRAEKCLGAIAWGKSEADVFIMRDACNLLHDDRTKPKLSDDSLVKQCIWPGCDYYFLNKAFAVRHLLLNHIVWPTNCHKCREPMKRDIVSHNCLQSCLDCGHESVNIQRLTQHLYSSHTIFYCQLCEMNFTELSAIKSHLIAENKMLLKTCIICRYSVPPDENHNASAMFEHILKYHGPAGKKMFLSASKPVSPSADYDDMLSGKKCVEDTTLKPVTRVTNRSKPLRHETYQFDSFKCPHCNKLFSARAGLKIHAGIAHRKMYIHFCPRCPITFPSVLECKNHLKEAHSKSKGQKQNLTSQSIEEALPKRKHRSIVPSNISMDGNDNPTEDSSHEIEDVEDDNIIDVMQFSDDNYENEDNEDISSDSIKKELNTDTSNPIITRDEPFADDNSNTKNSKHQVEEITSVTVEDDFQNILEEVKSESVECEINQQPPKKKKRPMPGLLKISPSLSRDSSVSPEKEVSNPLSSKLPNQSQATNTTRLVQTGFHPLPVASLKPIYKKILPKEAKISHKVSSTSPIVVRSQDGSTIQLVKKTSIPSGNSSTSVNSTPQLVSAGSLNPIMLPYPSGSFTQSQTQAQFQIRTSHGMINVVQNSTSQASGLTSPAVQITKAGCSSKPNMNPGHPQVSAVKSDKVTTGAGQIQIGTGNILPNGQIELIGATGNKAQGLGNTVQFQVVDGKVIPVQMVNAGASSLPVSIGQIRLGKPQENMSASVQDLIASAISDVQRENKTISQIVILQPDQLCSDPLSHLSSSKVTINKQSKSKRSDQLDMKSKTGKLRLVPGQSLLKNSSSSKTSVITVVSDDDHEMEVDTKVEKAEYNNIMVDKVALNLPVVMTKRNNAKIAQDNPCLEVFMKNNQVWGKCRICQQLLSTNQMSEALDCKKSIENHFYAEHKLNMEVHRKKLFYELKFDAFKCKYKRCFLCSYCGKEFTTKFNVRRHQMLYCPRKSEIDPLLLGLRPGNLEKRNLGNSSIDDLFKAGLDSADADHTAGLDSADADHTAGLDGADNLKELIADGSIADDVGDALEIKENIIEEGEDEIELECNEIIQQDDYNLGSSSIVMEAMAQLDRIEKDIDQQVIDTL